MPNVSKTTIEGVATMTQGVGTSPARKFIGRLPMDGSWSIKGTVQAVNPATTGRVQAQQVVFNIAASGIAIDGAITPTDGQSGIASTQPEEHTFRGTSVAFAYKNGNPSATPPVPPSFEVVLTPPCAAGVSALYGAELEVTSVTP
jgi:hypothetical protein